MRHPRSLAERRHNRVTVMARRRKIICRWYDSNDLRKSWKPEESSAWYLCDKWNLNCTCRVCRFLKSLESRLPRQQLKRDIIDNIRAWDNNSEGLLSCG